MEFSEVKKPEKNNRMTITMVYLRMFLQEIYYSTKRRLAIMLCNAGCNNYKLNYTASRLEELAWIKRSTNKKR